MKTTLQNMLALCGLIVFAAWSTHAQTKSSQDSDLLRERIEQLESIDLKSKSSSVQDIYKHTLLRLYNQYIVSLQQDIRDLNDIQAVSGSDSDPQNEITNKIQQLAKAQSLTTEKIQTLKGDVNIDASSDMSTSKLPQRAPERSIDLNSPTEGNPVALKSSDGAISYDLATLAPSPRPGPQTSPTEFSFGPVIQGDTVVKGFVKPGTKTVEVEVRQKEKQPGQTEKIQKIIQHTINAETGQFSVKLDQALETGQQVRMIQDGAASEWAYVKPVERGSEKVSIPRGEYLRTILGFEQVRASSTDSVQNPFLNLFVSIPIASSKRWRAWGDVRLTNAPQPTSTTLTNIASSFIAPALSGKASDLTQSAVVLGGAEYKLGETKWPPLLGFLGETRQRFAVSILVGGGFTTPLSVRDSIAQFNLNDTARTALKGQNIDIPADKTVVAFVSPERDRFFRQYFGGFRFTTFYFDKDKRSFLNRLPANLDITIGQNEQVTTRLRGSVLRLEGFYPLPFQDAKFIYLFGTGVLKLGRAKINDHPLVLEPVTTPLSLSDPKLAIVPTPPANRDYYRLGIGVDFLELIKTIKDKAATPK